jgi:putative spermidine/putrescine transport system substrate-binding protein
MEKRMSNSNETTRRRFLKAAGATGAGLALPTIWTRRAVAADQLTIADYGGVTTVAHRKAFYEPFEKETGIRIISVAHGSDPVTQFKLAVDSGSHIWDICVVTPDHVERLVGKKNYLAPLGIAPGEVKNILPGMLTENWFGYSVYAVLMAYRTDKYPKNGPTGWKDFWDTQKFPGRRGLYRAPIGLFENALLADGVAPHDLYPIDVNRAFKSLDKIRSSVSVWWANGAQNTQLLQNGEVDMADTWNSRVMGAIDAGAPLKMVWEGTYNADGWTIVSGTPRLKQAQQFVRFCMDPKRQAVYSSMVSNGPSNSDAYKYIDKEKAVLLPTYPKNLERLVRRDTAWWGKNFDPVSAQFQEWLLKS